MNKVNVRGSSEPKCTAADTQQIQQRLTEVHRLMEQLEDRVLFDAVPDAGLMVEAETLNQFFDSATAATAVESSSQVESSAANEIVFIDASVAESDQLLQDLLANTDRSFEVHLLDGNADGIEQIAAALSERDDIDAVHLISHGSQSQLRVGTAVLDTDSMHHQYADELAVINAALRDDADLLIYGCNFGQGAAGRAAADTLAMLTGADVAASSDETGIEFRGGDWYLEYTTGNIQTEILVSVELQQHWNVILGTPAVEFFVTLDEQGIYDANEKILNEGAYGNVTEQVISTIGIVANNDNTIIYYDHHEDGYETDLDTPTQATTETWGDGDVSNGAAPGVTVDADDVINAGDFVVLQNTVDLTNPPTAGSVLYDGTDRFGSNSSLAVTRGAWHTYPGTPLAGTTEVADVARWGTTYVSPIGEDTVLNNLYEYTGMFIIAAQDGTSVSCRRQCGWRFVGSRRCDHDTESGAKLAY